MDSVEVEPITEVVAILLAGGDGSRLGESRPKAFVGVGGKVPLAHSLEAFERHPRVDAIVLVVPEGWQQTAEVIVDDIGCDRVSAIEVGGASRAASVLGGLQAVADTPGTVVLVHDSARPIVPHDLVDRVLRPIEQGWAGAVPVLPATDTVKRVGTDGGIEATIPRDDVRLAQTPQACRATMLREALAQASAGGDLEQVTDCTQALELAGHKVCAVDGDARCIKVTYPRDVDEVTYLLDAQKETS